VHHLIHVRNCPAGIHTLKSVEVAIGSSCLRQTNGLAWLCSVRCSLSTFSLHSAPAASSHGAISGTSQTESVSIETPEHVPLRVHFFSNHTESQLRACSEGFKSGDHRSGV
jgi:hypothetical protein